MPIKIVSKKDGFRRAGLAHSGSQVYPDDKFTPAQLEALKAEKFLDVSEVDEMPEKDADKKKGGK